MKKFNLLGFEEKVFGSSQSSLCREASKKAANSGWQGLINNKFGWSFFNSSLA